MIAGREVAAPDGRRIEAGAAPQTVVARLPDFLGEAVMAEPMLRALADAGLRVEAFGRRWCRDLFAGVGVEVEGVDGAFAELGGYRRARARWAVTARSSFTTAAAMRLAGLRVVGRRGNLRSPLLARALPRGCRGHRIDGYLELGLATAEAVLGRRGADRDRPAVPRIAATGDQRDEAVRRLEAEGVRFPFVMACPTANHPDGSPFKLWPRFPAMLGRMVDAGTEVVVCPGRGETAWYHDIPGGVRVLDGVGMSCLVGIVSLAESMISNDTGPAHLAAALGVPTVTVFGDTDHRRYEPRGPRALRVGALGAWPGLEEVWSAWLAQSAGRAPGGSLGRGKG
ncbi:MAG TPA: glycosyltransferase family 9 protein [Candidatus Sulfomarinibacteraceae bacterium]|nr:glycosyltransferase family 9 protein [Candidatus Sulfomarinibacteraceae bacterium]